MRAHSFHFEAGCLELGEKIISTSYIFVRNTYNKYKFDNEPPIPYKQYIHEFSSFQRPCLYIPHDKHSVAVSVCPIKFELSKSEVLL